MSLFFISVYPFHNRSFFKEFSGRKLEILGCAFDVVLCPTDSFSLHEYLKRFTIVFLIKHILYLFSFCHESVESFGFYGFFELIRELPSRDRIMFFMSREGKSMELGNAIGRNESECISEIRIGFTRESDDEISSDIHPYRVFAVQ